MEKRSNFIQEFINYQVAYIVKILKSNDKGITLNGKLLNARRLLVYLLILKV
jgi:hypothetical protein